MTATKVFAPAKINLTLHVTGQRADGYHLLDSLVMFADLGDHLTLRVADHMHLTVTGPFADGVPTDARNLVWRAADAAGWQGEIALHKALPHGAGIGGGSSDAAAVLRALGADVETTALGADVPVCILARAAQMQGVGDVVTALPKAPPFGAAVLVNPGVHLPTPDVFSALPHKTHPPMSAFPDPDAGPAVWLEWLATQRNDLQDAAISVAPEIRAVLSALERCAKVQLARMSGSGATCFGLFPNAKAASAAALDLQARHAGWWVAPVQLS